MANRDEVIRIVATCENCGSVYAARQWPDGDIQPIGSNSCGCGSADFVPVDETDTAASSDASAE